MKFVALRERGNYNLLASWETYLGADPGHDEDDEDEDDLDDPEDALEGAEVVLSAPDTPGQVAAGGSPGRAALLHTDVVAGLGHGLGGGRHLLKYQDGSEPVQCWEVGGWAPALSLQSPDCSLFMW